jgi:DNA-binding NtrC family response regulator
VRVNCGAVPPGLVDSELFGHERGDFTGNQAPRQGWFERADGGTLFLDEISELSLEAQVRVLRILQGGTFERVGGQRSLSADVRIIGATHRDLREMVSRGTFREDLWHRISVFPIHLPPLRERREDIPRLAAHFAARAATRLVGVPLMPTLEDLDLLLAYDWPGNVRQLENAVYRAIVLADAPYLQPHDFPSISGVAAPPPEPQARPIMAHANAAPPTTAELLAEMPKDAPVRILDARGHLRTLEEIERDLIQLAIEIYAGHMSEVARRLGIGRSTLYRKVREQGLDDVLKGQGVEDEGAATANA